MESGSLRSLLAREAIKPKTKAKTPTDVRWGKTLQEVILGKTVLILMGGMLIGFLTSTAGYEKVSPFFIELLTGFLALFLLHLGYTAGSNLSQVKAVGWRLGVFAIAFPLISGLIGAAVGTLVGDPQWRR